jgi:glycosyltransferase involved in cell wall biosynthesis
MRAGPYRVAALVPYPPDVAASQRFRIEQWRAPLRAEGIEIHLLPFANPRLMRLLYKPGAFMAKAVALAATFARRAVEAATLGAYDVLLVHRAAALFGPAVLERAVAAWRPIIFDFDDAIFLSHTTEANGRYRWFKCPGKTATICRRSAYVVVGNAYLASYARQHNARVAIIPSSVDVDHYRPAARPHPGRLVVGWMGSSTSQIHLELFAPGLRALARIPNLEVRVVSDRRPVLPGVQFTWRAWSRETELDELRAFDIGIMPMPVDPWSEGKCAMKALLYMAVGVPVVASAVGMNRELIRHGENGLLAESPADFDAAVETLARDRGLRQRLGQAGRVTVESGYSMRRCALLFGEVIRQVASGAMVRQREDEQRALSAPGGESGQIR